MSITNVSLTTVFVTDQDAAKRWYTEKLGFVEAADVTMGEYRWLTVAHPDHPELEVGLAVPGPPLDDELAAALRRSIAKGTAGGLGLRTDDCQKTFEELTAKGVEFVQQPTARPYGVEAIIRDVCGNWLVLVEPKPFDPSRGQ